MPIAAHHLGHRSNTAFRAGIEEQAVGALQQPRIGSDFLDVQGWILRGDSKNQGLFLLAAVAVQPFTQADVEGRHIAHPLHPQGLGEAGPGKIELFPQVEIAPAHHHQLAVQPLQGALLTVIEAPGEPQLEEHQHVGETHPGDGGGQPHGPVDRLAPGQGGALQQLDHRTGFTGCRAWRRPVAGVAGLRSAVGATAAGAVAAPV